MTGGYRNRQIHLISLPTRNKTGIERDVGNFAIV